MTTLTVIGGSAASVGTGQGCASYLVQTETTSIVLDAGPGTLQELRKHTDFRALDAVVISHLHVDHMLDVIAMRFSLSYNPVKPTRKVQLWLPPGGLDAFHKLASVFDFETGADTFFTTVFDLAEYDPNGSVEIGNLTLTFAPTVHWVPCWSIRVSPANGSGDLVYTADTGPSADLEAHLAGAQVIISEATTPDAQANNSPFNERGHITPSEAATWAKRAGASTLVLSHMFEENDPEACVATARTVFGGAVVRGEPGARVTW
jgi:ribonuclease BN (tRNA processing enzyme)